MKKAPLIKIRLQPRYIKDYSAIIPADVKKAIELGKEFKGVRLVNVNATSVGGGVAEILRSVVPLYRDVGVKADWYAIPPFEEFFEVTKQIHNYMQGKKGDLSKEDKKIYLDYNRYIASLLDEVDADIFIIHDPQPAACLKYMKNKKGKFFLWRCHIDTSNPNKKVWNFLLPYLKKYDHYVFTMADFAQKSFPKEKISFITPVIDAISEKNIWLGPQESKQLVSSFGVDCNKPLVTQISRFDPWKDPKGVIDAYCIARKKIKDLQLALVGQKTSEDPEGERIYRDIKDYIKGKKGSFTFINLPESNMAINAFQRVSDVVLQKSLREGFGLTVAEAMWKEAVVIGGNVGGIRLQIDDGESGFLVDTPAQAAKKILWTFENPKKAKEMGRTAHDKVRNNYLMPHKIINYLTIFKEKVRQLRK